MNNSICRIFSCALVMLFYCHPGAAQTIFLSWVEVKDNKMIIHYDLNDAINDRQYAVSLYSSHDNFIAALAEITGDAGKGIVAGMDKKIEWNITKELPAFRGNLTFEVRARIYIPFIKSISIDEGKTYKRGKIYPIKWIPGNVNTAVSMELYKGSKRIVSNPVMPNDGTYQWLIPASSQLGNDYKWKYVNASDTREVAWSHAFTIRRKVPLGYKVLAVGVIGGAAAVLGSGKSTPDSPNPPTDKILPGPPDPP